MYNPITIKNWMASTVRETISLMSRAQDDEQRDYLGGFISAFCLTYEQEDAQGFYVDVADALDQWQHVQERKHGPFTKSYRDGYQEARRRILAELR